MILKKVCKTTIFNLIGISLFLIIIGFFVFQIHSNSNAKIYAADSSGITVFTASSGVAQYRVYPKVTYPASVPVNNYYSDGTIYIDLDKEILQLPGFYSIAAYSIDGGGTWSKGSIKKLSNLFDKQLNLVLTDSFNSTKSSPADNAVIIIFPEILARSKAVSMLPNYLITADSSGTCSNWLPTPKGKSCSFSLNNYEISQSFKKTELRAIKDFNYLRDCVWSDVSLAGIQALGVGSEKEIYYIRHKPQVFPLVNIYVPASKATQLTPDLRKKAPNLKINNDGTVIVRDGMTIIANNICYQYNEKTKVSVVSLLKAYGGEVKIFVSATEKKPASELQTITFEALKGSYIIDSLNNPDILVNSNNVS